MKITLPSLTATVQRRIDARNNVFLKVSGDFTGKQMLYFAANPPDRHLSYSGSALPFPSESFAHVVFDPPHMEKLGDTGHYAMAYGKLRGNWREELRLGFAECFRVLKINGTLIFKWCEIEIPLRDVLSLTPHKPLYGHRSGKAAKTHWVAFIKEEDPLSDIW